MANFFAGLFSLATLLCVFVSEGVMVLLDLFSVRYWFVLFKYTKRPAYIYRYTCTVPVPQNIQYGDTFSMKFDTYSYNCHGNNSV